MRIAAVDIGGTDIKYTLLEGENLRVFSARKYPTPQGGGRAILSQVGDLLAGLGAFEAIAVCTAGQVNPVTGEIIYANENIPDYTGTKVRQILGDRFAKPVTVLNDVNAAALGEGYLGAARGYSDYLCLTYGTGIGGAIVIGGRLYEGATYSAGEFGHIITHKGGERCACGGSGCYERYASTRALSLMAEARFGLRLSGYQIFERLEDPSMRDLVDGWIEEILTGIASLCHIFNPACIVVGGGIMEQPYLIHGLEAGLGRHIIKSYSNVALRKAELGNNAGMLGAAIYALKTQGEDANAGE
jgi:glucokinase